MLVALYQIKNALEVLSKDIPNIIANGGAELFSDPEIHLNLGNAMLGIEELIKDAQSPYAVNQLAAKVPKLEEELRTAEDLLMETRKFLTDGPVAGLAQTEFLSRLDSAISHRLPKTPPG